MVLWDEIRSVADPNVRRGLLERLAKRMAAGYAGEIQGDTLDRAAGIAAAFVRRTKRGDGSRSNGRSAGVAGGFLPVSRVGGTRSQYLLDGKDSVQRVVGPGCEAFGVPIGRRDVLHVYDELRVIEIWQRVPQIAGHTITRPTAPTSDEAQAVDRRPV